MVLECHLVVFLCLTSQGALGTTSDGGWHLMGGDLFHINPIQFHRWHFSGKNCNSGFSCASSSFILYFKVTFWTYFADSFVKSYSHMSPNMLLKNVDIRSFNLLNLNCFYCCFWRWNSTENCQVSNARATIKGDRLENFPVYYKNQNAFYAILLKMVKLVEKFIWMWKSILEIKMRTSLWFWGNG